MLPRRVIHILCVEDNPGDIRLLQEALSESQLPYQLHVTMDGEKALDFLRADDQPTPHLILLNLNLPRKSGHEVLEEIKQDAILRRIPVIVLSSSAAAADVGRAYDLHANCFIQKPMDLDEFFTVLHVIEDLHGCAWPSCRRNKRPEPSSPQNRAPTRP